MSTRALRPEDPRAIGPYRLLARLGAGGMGSVFAGRSAGGRTVAIKLVHPELARDAGFRRRFRQEVEAARQVGGEFTASVLDADPDADVPWLATAYIAGPSLHEVVDGGYGPLPERSLRQLAAGLGRALRAVHARGLVHRDLKPANVLLTLDGPRVIDFGIARAVDSTIATRTGAVVGTPAFMSPEQVRGERVTPAGDVFSLGSVLAFAATGRLPFAAGEGGVHALMMRIVSAEPDLAGLDGPLRDLVGACLAKRPEERPSPEEIVERAGDGGGPWLPDEVVHRIGRHAVALLDLEGPEAPGMSGTGPTGVPAPALRQPSGSPLGTPPAPPPSPERRTEYWPTQPPNPGSPGSTGFPVVPAVLAAVALLAVALIIVVVAVSLETADGTPAGSQPSAASDGSTSATRRSAAPPPATGDVRPDFIGTWQGPADGSRNVQLIIRQGRRGADVAAVRVTGRGYVCHGVGRLVRAEGMGLTLDTRVTRSEPPGRCDGTGVLTGRLITDDLMFIRDGGLKGNLRRLD
ncbi:serine/threonine-protein kinase [Spirillospora sp. NPDC029432]|uniref:serine/threonine-protein kinase n=1 Tax=Spirillospora sp. NPDC029432 TaxID=3154599 RepID=UPI003454E35C